jgi:Ankyrin repeats (3 copies)
MRTWASERTFVMPVRELPSHPNLDHLRYQAKDLLKAHAARTLAAAQLIREFHPNFRSAADAQIFAAKIKLSDAQLTIAREHGFPTWARLKARIERPTQADRLDLPHHERIEDPVFRRAVDLMDAGDEAGLRAHLRLHPQLARQRVSFDGGNYFRNPALLEFIAENPIRRGSMPKNIVAVAEVILDAGMNSKTDQAALDDTLGLVCSGRIARECGAQIPLIVLLCGRGADANYALLPAVGHGEFEAARALIHAGARLTLSVASALGHGEDFRRLLPAATAEERYLALALGSQFGRVEIVRLLLDTGEDPSRYNPVGSHAHSTPLHQAALAGPTDLVRLLVERGAQLDMKDLLWNGTPAGWAHHAGNAELEAWLREQESSHSKPV